MRTRAWNRLWRPLIGALVALVWATPALRGQTDRTDEAVSRELRTLLTRYEAWGFSGTVLVARKGRIILEEGYGLANRATGERNTPKTRFDFASISKTFTGAATLLLDADGLLSVNERLERYIGPMPAAKSEATVQQLATHMAGLAKAGTKLAYGTDRAHWIESMKNATIDSPPGERYRYSNAGFSLLAAIDEQVSGVKFEDLIRRRLIEPAGLKETVFYPEIEPGSPGIAVGYVDTSTTPAPPEYKVWGWGDIGATGMISTVGDIYRWFEAVRSGRILGEAELARAFDPDAVEAYGWHVDHDAHGRRRIHKGGGLVAMQTQLMAFPDDSVVFVWAHNNMANNWRRALNEGIAAVALGDDYVLPPAVAATAGPRPEGGWYATPDGTAMYLENAGEGLALGGNGLGVRPAAFRPGEDGSWVLFDPEQRTGLTLSPRGTGGVVVRPLSGGHELALALDPDAAVATTPLAEPSEGALVAARELASLFEAGDAEGLRRRSMFRPISGAYATPGWARRIELIKDEVGTGLKRVDEAWILRNGSWRYWSTLRGSSGRTVVLRFLLTENGLIGGFGMNAAAAVPKYDERRPVA